MGNCMDTPAPPVDRRRYADPARPSSLYQPYTLYPGYVRHSKFAGQPEYPAGRLSAYPVTSPYLPFDDRHSLSYDDWSAKQYYEQVQFRGQYGVLPPNGVPHFTNGVTRPANGVKHQTNGVAHRDNPKDTKNRQSTVIKTFPNPQDDFIKRGTQVILASSTAPVSLSINGKDAQQAPASKETSGKRGSTYITYIQDPPPPPPEDDVKSSASSNHGEPEVVQTTSQVFQLFIDEPFSPPSSSLVKSSDTVTKMARKLPPKDVVLCYGSLDDIVTKVKKSMESAGLTVWLSRIKSINAEEDFQLAAQAVVNCKMLVVLLKSDTVNLRPLRDQVSLAQICDKVIFPVSVDLPLDVITTMEMGIKLQLGSYKWFELSVKNTLDLSILQMVRHVKEEISVIGGYDIIDEDFGQVSSKPRSEKISRQHKLKRMLYLGNHVTAAHFWDTHYGDLGPKVTWDRFLQELRQAYRELINCSIPKSCHAHLDHVLRSELTFDGTVRKENFIEFCKDLGTDRDVWEVVHSVAMVTQAMRDVFDSNSTVRAVAINNIGKFLSSTILTCLRSLMADADPSIRSASVSTLATCIQATDHVSVKALVDSLDDGDHVVRLEACKAVARLKSQEAVEKLLLLWHNDVIPQVRHAAGAALTQIGGREVQQAMKSTNVQPAEVSQREYIISS